MQRKPPAPRLSKGTPDFQLLVLTLLLVGFGVVMVFSASSNTAAVSKLYNFDAFYFVKRQLMWAVLGLIAMLIAMNIPYQFYKKWFLPLFIVTAILLLLVPYFGASINGARSWFRLGPISIQPTEIAKIAMVLYLSALITKKGEKFREFKRGLFPVMIIVGFVIGLIMLQPDFGSAFIIAITAGIIVIAGGANLKHILNCALVGLLGIVTVLGINMLIPSDGTGSDYKMGRIQSWLDPFHDAQNASYNLLQSLKAIAHGGWTGAGFGQSIQKLLYLPYPYNDFIFAVIAEELGFIGTTIFLCFYAYFVLRGLLIALRCPDIFGTLVGVGIIGNIAIQAFINIGGVTRTIPITGVTLPFISAGGTSLFITMASIGILLSISRESNRTVQEKTERKSPTEHRKDYRPIRPV
ncbi:putative lipid II flippase FtsW [Paenibacillus sp. 1001270B_150601_E10]|uniref:putative lipid II flippase FtsW n=1 Tax=Paenibacillus sp. 1001270B_150601_E10 TaxID=2787079 RepID=UPI00189FD736|nr:putative lipid II flippase FtsW [Paenibacillus sp. 1001270B_150601_E10]